MTAKDFRKATLSQLSAILRCPDTQTIYKCIAQSEVERRLQEYGYQLEALVRKTA
jgi:hypothetical protein